MEINAYINFLTTDFSCDSTLLISNTSSILGTYFRQEKKN